MSLIDDNFALIAPSTRNIGGIVPDVVVEEHHFDRLITTEHPVELGAAITDHAFRAPCEVIMKIGFSNSSAGTEGWVQEAYILLLTLQGIRQPFDVTTGKRVYSNMLVETIEVVTDPESEYALNCTVSLREVIIVSTQQASSTGIAPSAANQAMPQSTSPVQPGGTAQLQPAPNTGDFESVQAAIG